MRKRRVILVDDETIILVVLRNFFEMRGYEVLALAEPTVCPVYGENASCSALAPCADLLITDNKMPRMSGLELLAAQAQRGCRLTPRNKALLSGYLEPEDRERLEALGSAHFQKPVEFLDLGSWVDGCEERMDLSVPLPFKRREERQACREEVRYRSEGADGFATGLAVNRSRSGLCLKAAEPIARGTTVLLQTGNPPASLSARVCWTAPAGDGSYLSGLLCR